MSRKKMTTYLSMAAVVLMLGVLAASNPVYAGGDEVRLRAQLTAAVGDLSGQADFRNRLNRNRRQWSVEVEGFAPGDMFDVMVAGQNVGTIVIDGFGMGNQDFDDNFEAGDDPATQFPANFPALNGGEFVQVGPLSGTLQPK